MTLQEDLDELSKTLPGLVGEVREVHERLETVDSALAKLLSGAQPIELGFRNRVGVTAQRAEHLISQIDAMQKGLESAMAALEKAWTDADTHLEASEKHVVTAAEGIEPARQALLTALVATAERVDQASSHGPEALEALETAASAGHDEIPAAVGVAQEHTGKLHEFLEATSGRAADHTQMLLDTVAGASHDLTKEIDTFEQEMAHVGLELVAHDEQVRDALVEGVTDLLDDTCEPRLKETILPRVGGAADRAQAALVELARTATERGKAVDEACESLVEEVTRLDALSVTLGASMDQIHQAAAKLHQP
jgi:phage shock protein A